MERIRERRKKNGFCATIVTFQFLRNPSMTCLCWVMIQFSYIYLSNEPFVVYPMIWWNSSKIALYKCVMKRITAIIRASLFLVLGNIYQERRKINITHSIYLVIHFHKYKYALYLFDPAEICFSFLLTKLWVVGKSCKTKRKGYLNNDL